MFDIKLFLFPNNIIMIRKVIIQLNTIKLTARNRKCKLGDASASKSHSCRFSKKPLDLDLHCLPLSMWIYINNMDEIIWWAENLKMAWHPYLFSWTRDRHPAFDCRLFISTSRISEVLRNISMQGIYQKCITYWLFLHPVRVTPLSLISVSYANPVFKSPFEKVSKKCWMSDRE